MASASSNTANDESGGPPKSAFDWRRQLQTQTNLQPGQLINAFRDKSTNKTVSGSRFPIKSALALRAFWTYHATWDAKYVFPFLTGKDIVTQTDVNFAKDFLASPEPSGPGGLRHRIVTNLSNTAIEQRSAQPLDRQQIYDEVLKGLNMLRDSLKGAPLGDSYTSRGLVVRRFLETIDETLTSDNNLRTLGWVNGMTMDTFLGGFRASVGHYAQIVTHNSTARPDRKTSRRHVRRPDYSAEDETIVTVCFAGFVSGVQNRISDCIKNPAPNQLVPNARGSGQTRPSRLSLRFGPNENECANKPPLKFAGYNSDVDGYVFTSGGHISDDPSVKKQAPIMIEVKASSSKSYVWRQLVAEMAAWIHETEPSQSASPNKSALRHKILFTQHGAEIYLIVGSFGEDYLRFIHSNDVSSAKKTNNELILSSTLDGYISQHAKATEKERKDLEPKINSGMLHINRWGPYLLHKTEQMAAFFNILTAILNAKDRESTRFSEQSRRVKSAP